VRSPYGNCGRRARPSTKTAPRAWRCNCPDIFRSNDRSSTSPRPSHGRCSSLLPPGWHRATDGPTPTTSTPSPSTASRSTSAACGDTRWSGRASRRSVPPSSRRWSRRRTRSSARPLPWDDGYRIPRQGPRPSNPSGRADPRTSGRRSGTPGASVPSGPPPRRRRCPKPAPTGGSGGDGWGARSASRPATEGLWRSTRSGPVATPSPTSSVGGTTAWIT
jgi:hypothetical protein